MGQTVREMLIRLNGEVGAGFGKIGDSLSNLGYALDRVGRYTREFEKESVNVYRSYEDQMLAAKYALSAQVDSATELERQMAGLDEAARKWAASSIFHTDDVSQAINEAAHAGWEYQEILEGIPQAMLIAQAGGLELSDGLDYLVKMMNATRTPMSEMGTVVDQWAMAANISATNIDELGQAFISMGAAAQFGDSTAELFSMLAALANVGTTGTKAGTALRNTIMRLIAPTTKAEAAMDLLGADAEELQEVLADENVTKAAKTLEGLGFSAFDKDTGKLKPIKDIFAELFTMTEGLDDAAKDELLAAIFPTRTIATALSLLTASNGELDEMYEKIKNSDGYAGKGADIMMSGLTGSIETLKSKWEEFKRSIGETLAPHIEKIAEGLGNFVDGLNNMSPEALSGITSMLTVLSYAGPLLIGVGAVTKLVGLLGPIGTLALVAGLGVSYLWGYLTKLDQINWEGHFGTLKVDLDELNQYVDSIETKFDTEQQAITKWSEAVQAAQENYNSALTDMNEGLLKKVLTGGTFTDADYQQFVQLGKDIVKYTQEGIENAEARDQSLLQALFSDKSSLEEIEGYDNLSGLMDYYYSDLYDEARKIGENIRLKLTEALGNGELTAEDRAYIQTQIGRLNQINAEIAAGLQEEAYYAQLEKAGRVSWETISEFLSSNEQKLKEEHAAIDEQYDTLWGQIKHAFEVARKNGDKTVTFTDSAGQKRTVDVSEEAEEEAHKLVNDERAAAHASANTKFGSISQTAFDELMRDSEYAEGWAFMKDMYAKYGGIPLDEDGMPDISKLGLEGKTDSEVESLYNQLYGIFRGDSNFLGLGQGKLSDILKGFKDYEGIGQYLEMLGDDFDYFSAVGDFQSYKYNFQHNNEDPYGLFGTYEQLAARYEYGKTKNDLESLYQQQAKIDKEIGDRQKRMEDRNYDIFGINSYNKDWTALNGKNGEGGGLLDQKAQIELEIAEAEGKVSELEGVIAGMNTEKDVIFGVDSKEVDAWQPPKKHGTVEYDVEQDFALGGRATQASVFGEAGPEWAIPEKHTERTAQLLDAARRASGFTWGDIISRFGGMNANPGNSPVVLNYSPTINAGDAKGVAGALAADRDKLVKMVKQALEEAQFRDSVEVYA